MGKTRVPVCLPPLCDERVARSLFITLLNYTCAHQLAKPTLWIGDHCKNSAEGRRLCVHGACVSFRETRRSTLS